MFPSSFIGRKSAIFRSASSDIELAGSASADLEPANVLGRVKV